MSENYYLHGINDVTTTNADHSNDLNMMADVDGLGRNQLENQISATYFLYTKNDSFPADFPALSLIGTRKDLNEQVIGQVVPPLTIVTSALNLNALVE